MGKFLDFLLILIAGLVILSLFVSCGTTSLMRCDRFVGPEKEECVRTTELQQRQMLNVRERMIEDRMGRRKY